MSTTTVTLTGNVSDAIGTDFDSNSTKVWVVYNTDKVVTDGSDPIRLGAHTDTVAADGTFSLANVVASTSLVTDLTATVKVNWRDTAGTVKARREVAFGPYDLSGLSGTVNIRSLEAVQALDASRASVLMSAMETLRDEAAASAALAHDISGIATPDGVVKVLVEDPDSLTSGALAESLVARTDGVANRASMRNKPVAAIMTPALKAFPAAAPLTIPTPDGSGEATHPDALYVPEGFAGYQWWMVVTPLPGGVSGNENPCVVCSHDGLTWAPPSGLTNPVEPTPGSGYNSDAELVLDHDGTMFLFWRKVTTDETFYYRTSTDGVTWTAKTMALNVPGTGLAAEFLSPSITWDAATQEWAMFAVDQQTIGATSPLVQKRTCATLTGTWSAPTAGTIAVPNFRTGAAQHAWHIDVVWHAGMFHALVMAQGSGAKTLSMAVSDDGLTWASPAETLMYHSCNSSGRWDDLPYRGCIVPLVDGRWRIYHGGTSGSNVWRIGMTETIGAGQAMTDAAGRTVVGDTYTVDSTAAAYLDMRPKTDIPLIKGLAPASVDIVRLYDPTGATLLTVVRNGGGVKLGGYGGAKATGSGAGVWGTSEFQNALHAATNSGAFYVGPGDAASGAGVIAIGNAAANPSGSPVGGGVLYAQAGALKWLGSSGTVTTLGPA